MPNSKRFSDKLIVQFSLVVIATGCLIVFITHFSDLLKPLAIAIIVWYLIKAVHSYISKIRIMKRQLPRWLRGVISLLIIFLCLELVIEIVITNLSEMLADYRSYETTFMQYLLAIGESLEIENITERLQTQISRLNMQGFLENILSSLSVAVGNIMIAIIYIIFLLLEEVAFSNKIDIIFNDVNQRTHIRSILNAIYQSTNKYITLKTYISLLAAVLSYVILLLFGIKYAFLWSFSIFILNYIPYIGSLVSSIMPAIFTLIQVGSFWTAFWLLLCITSVQLIVGNYIEPKLMGRSLNLSPLVVVIALSFWGSVWGLLGMFLAVPITSVLLVVLAQFNSTRKFAILLTERGSIENIIISPLNKIQ